jgi:hypothetical protein
VENYRRSAEFKIAQVGALERSVGVATDLFQGARAEYGEVLFTQRELLDARTDLIEIKQEQLSAIVDAYRALGGGFLLSSSGIEATEAFYLTPQGETIEVLPQPTPAEDPMLNEESLPGSAEEMPASPDNQVDPAAPANGDGAGVLRGAASQRMSSRTVPPPVKLETLE